MRLTFAVLAAVATTVVAQGVTEILTPTSSPPPQCNPSYSGKFELTVQALSKRGIEERQKSGLLTCTLENGILTDSDNRTGYIASNFQFQFDGPPQAGAIYTAGWTICANDSLALGGSAVFYQCLSGSFYNLYDRYWAGQCQPVNLQIIPLGGGSTTAVESGASQTAPAPSGSALSQNSNGAPVATGVSNATSLATASGNVTMTASPTMSTASQSAAKTSSSSAKSSSSSGLAAIATPLANLGALAIGLIGAVAVL